SLGLLQADLSAGLSHTIGGLESSGLVDLGMEAMPSVEPLAGLERVDVGSAELSMPGGLLDLEHGVVPGFPAEQEPNVEIIMHAEEIDASAGLISLDEPSTPVAP